MTDSSEHISFAEAYRDLFIAHRTAGVPDFHMGVVGKAFDAILDGAWTDIQVGAFLAAVGRHPVTSTLLCAGAESLRYHMRPVEHDLPVVADTCGSGGDGRNTLNISTAAAIILAAAGIPVAKHGNRAASGRVGSADVVEALGIPLIIPPERQVEILREAGICFLFAPVHHPGLMRIAHVRKQLGIRTVFNLLGPLVNPARVTHQLVGVPHPDLCRPVAETLRRCGVKRAWVVCGGGMDEISPYGSTTIIEVSEGLLREVSLAAQDVRGSRHTADVELRGGSVQENAAAIISILQGDPHPARDVVLLNAAAALCVATPGMEMRDAYVHLDGIVARGKPFEVLETWRGACERAMARS